jgi:hypothetical protein
MTRAKSSRFVPRMRSLSVSILDRHWQGGARGGLGWRMALNIRRNKLEEALNVFHISCFF